MAAKRSLSSEMQTRGWATPFVARLHFSVALVLQAGLEPGPGRRVMAHDVRSAVTRNPPGHDLADAAGGDLCSEIPRSHVRRPAGRRWPLRFRPIAPRSLAVAHAGPRPRTPGTGRQEWPRVLAPGPCGPRRQSQGKCGNLSARCALDPAGRERTRMKRAPRWHGRPRRRVRAAQVDSRSDPPGVVPAARRRAASCLPRAGAEPGPGLAIGTG